MLERPSKISKKKSARTHLWILPDGLGKRWVRTSDIGAVVFTKATMPAANPRGRALVMSKDQGSRGQGVFAFEGHEAALSFACAQKGGACNEVVEHLVTGCSKMFFDIDRPDIGVSRLAPCSSSYCNREHCAQGGVLPWSSPRSPTTARRSYMTAGQDVAARRIRHPCCLGGPPLSGRAPAAVAADKADAYPARVHRSRQGQEVRNRPQSTPCSGASGMFCIW
jgi:hypothetical protein